MPSDNTHCRTGLTLVETLVSLAIIGILVAILIPAIQATREAARKTQCQGNIRQTAIALHNFHTAKDSLPSQYNETSLAYPLNEWDLFHMHSWRAVLLPYIEQSALHDSVDWKTLATDPENDSIATTVVSTFVCPSGPSASSNTGSSARHDRSKASVAFYWQRLSSGHSRRLAQEAGGFECAGLLRFSFCYDFSWPSTGYRP